MLSSKVLPVAVQPASKGNIGSTFSRGYSQMERNTKGFSSAAKDRDRMTSGRVGCCRRSDSLNPSSRRVNRSLRAAEFDQFSRTIHRDLNPRGPLEQLVARQAIRSAWRLKANLDVEAGLGEDIVTDRAARSLEVAITTLDLLQGRREGSSTESVAPPEMASFEEYDDPDDTIEPNEWPILPTEETVEPDGASTDEEVPLWRDRLVFDFDVSDLSPVIKGTWITVSHVVSLIVDGATWADILRSHPELSEEDIRMCVCYAIDEDNSAI